MGAPGRLAALAAFALSVAAMLAAGLAATGGQLSYTLDDPYIHLALAERIAVGHYGLNAGEITTPSSSILWPFLLVPGAGSAWHPWLPFAINLVLGGLTSWLIGRMVDRWPADPEGSRQGLLRAAAVAVVLVFAGNLPALVLAGMEHELQVLLACLCALGLAEAYFRRPIPAWCLVAAALGPAVRYEMFALVAALGIALLAQRRWRAALALGAGSLVLPAAFGAWLVSVGLPPLPNSVLIKSGLAGQGGGLSARIVQLLSWPDGEHAVILVLIVALAAFAWHARGARWALIGAVLALVLQYLVGPFGWFARYEDYAVIFGAVLLCAAAGGAGHRVRHMAAVVALCSAVPYILVSFKVPAAMRNIYEQQYQMHRFVNGFYRGNFAVNDLGWVSYRLEPDVYVLDLWGLASNEARRQPHKDAAWLDDITHRHGVPLVMIYREWFESIPERWRLVATLWLSGPGVSAGARDVSFYVTDPVAAESVTAALRDFAPTLPSGVRLELQP